MTKYLELEDDYLEAYTSSGYAYLTEEVCPSDSKYKSKKANRF